MRERTRAPQAGFAAVQWDLTAVLHALAAHIRAQCGKP